MVISRISHDVVGLVLGRCCEAGRTQRQCGSHGRRSRRTQSEWRDPTDEQSDVDSRPSLPPTAATAAAAAADADDDAAADHDDDDVEVVLCSSEPPRRTADLQQVPPRRSNSNEMKWTSLYTVAAELRQYGTCMHSTIQRDVIKTLRKMLDKMQLHLKRDIKCYW